jgi:hypothetical protein
VEGLGEEGGEEGEGEGGEIDPRVLLLPGLGRWGVGIEGLCGRGRMLALGFYFHFFLFFSFYGFSLAGQMCWPFARMA